MSRQTRRTEDLQVGEDTFHAWVNPPMTLFASVAGATTPAKVIEELTKIIESHSVTDEGDQPLPVGEIAAPTLLQFIEVYVERVKHLPPR